MQKDIRPHSKTQPINVVTCITQGISLEWHHEGSELDNTGPTQLVLTSAMTVRTTPPSVIKHYN